MPGRAGVALAFVVSASACARGWTLPQPRAEGDAGAHDVSWFPLPGGDVISLDAGSKRDAIVLDARLDARLEASAPLSDVRVDVGGWDARVVDANRASLDSETHVARDATVRFDSAEAAGPDAWGADAAEAHDVPRDVGGVLECRAHALGLAERCSGNPRAACLWMAYAALCERGNPAALIEAMSCFGDSGCGTFSGAEAQSCVTRIYDIYTTAYSRIAQYRMRFYCSNERLFGPTSELQWSQFSPAQLLRTQGCVTEESSCATIDACFRRDFPEFVTCATPPADVRQPLDWLF